MNVVLNKRCRIERKTVTLDSVYGSEVVVWTLLAVIWCELRDIMLPSRSESIKQGLAAAANQSRFRARYRTDIDSSMRIIVDGTIYQIIGGPAEIGNHEFIECVLEKYSS